MRYLILETVASRPHLETAGEIALTLAKDGNDVVFCFVGDDLPWSDWELSRTVRLLGGAYNGRIQQFISLMREGGVQVVSSSAIDQQTKLRIDEWACCFSGGLEALKKYQYNQQSLGLGVASSLISYFRTAHFSPNKHLKLVKNALISAGLVFEKSKKIIAQTNPHHVVTFNGRFATTKPIVLAAELVQIPVLIHERGSDYSKYEIFSDSVHNFEFRHREIVRYWENADPSERQKLGHEFFARRRAGHGIGWHSFTADQEKGRIPQRASGKKRWVYFSSSDDEFAAISDGFSSGPWDSQIDAVQNLMELAASNSEVELVIRVHPHLKIKASVERARWATLKGPNIINIAPSDPTDSYSLIESSDVVFSFGSTIGIEAAYWGRPSVLLGASAYAKSGAVYTPTSASELKVLLSDSSAIPVASQDLCLPYGFYYLTFGRPFQFYQPTSLFEGTFLGKNLDWKPAYLRWLKQLGLNRVLHSINQRIHLG